jgi:predicted nucleic acid-binding protein
MVLVDTSAWIEWLIGSPLAPRIGPLLPSQPEWVVPTIVQLELAKWLTRQVGEDRADEVLASTQMCQAVVLDTRIARAAAEAGRAHKLATADAILYGTAHSMGASILTYDRQFDRLPGVVLIDKHAG